MGKIEFGATQSSVERPILRCLATGGWKQTGEIIDYVRRNGNLPAEALRPMTKRSDAPQFHQIVRNALNVSRTRNLTHQGFCEAGEYDSYRVTSQGRVRLRELEQNIDLLDEITGGQDLGD